MPPFPTSSSWVPHSVITPSAMEMILPAFRMVESLWAMIRVVLPFASASNARWILASVTEANAEQYPELKSNENYKQLMTELATTENLIANTRTNYNTWVSKYNSYVKKFPNRGILDMLGYEVQTFNKLTYDVSSDAPTNLFD